MKVMGKIWNIAPSEVQCGDLDRAEKKNAM